MILHTVAFSLEHAVGSHGEKQFFSAVKKLEELPMVQSLTCYRQRFSDTDFDFCIAVQFEKQTDYENYNTDPVHVSFVESTWTTEVNKYLILDYEPLANH